MSPNSRKANQKYTVLGNTDRVIVESYTALFLSSESHHEVKILRSNILKKFKSRLNLEGKRIMNDDLILLKLKDY